MKMKELTAAQVDANLAVASELNENENRHFQYMGYIIVRMNPSLSDCLTM